MRLQVSPVLTSICQSLSKAYRHSYVAGSIASAGPCLRKISFFHAQENVQLLTTLPRSQRTPFPLVFPSGVAANAQLHHDPAGHALQGAWGKRRSMASGSTGSAALCNAGV